MVSSIKDKPLVNVEPGILTFPYELKKQTSCTFRLSNNTKKPVAFKVMTTNQDKYCVKPNSGLILVRSTCEITVHMRAPREAFSDVEYKDKFFIKTVVARYGTTTENAWKLFKQPEDPVKETILGMGVTYIFPTQTTQQMVRLLDVEPQVVTFPFELGKEATCQLLLSNNTLLTVAFKIRTTDPKKYCVRPNSGRILAGSTCDVTVHTRCPKVATSENECKDKFKITSVIARVDASSKNAYELFPERAGDTGEDIKLRVKYVFPFKTKPSNSERAGSDASVTVSTVREEGLEQILSELQEWWDWDVDVERWGLNLLERIPSQTEPSIPMRRMENGTSPVNASTIQEGSLDNPKVLPGKEENGAPDSDLVRNLVNTGLLGLVLWLIFTKVVSLIWSLTFFITAKVINRLVSDSVEDWILKIVCYLFIHCVSTLFGVMKRHLKHIYDQY